MAVLSSMVAYEHTFLKVGSNRHLLYYWVGYITTLAESCLYSNVNEEYITRISFNVKT